jgi:TetR/AcrR family transcriptional repressor of nem operon
MFIVMRYSNFNKAERTRQFIVEKVAPIFNKKGYVGTSLRDLTAATGLTKGSVYGNFRNKDAVAIASFQYNADFITRNLLKNIDRAGTVVAKLRAYPDTYRRIYRAVLDNGGCPVLNTSADADDLNPELHAAAVRVITEWRAGLAAIVQKGRQAGEIQAQADPGRIAETILAIIEGGLAMTKATGEESFLFNALNAVEQMIDTIST